MAKIKVKTPVVRLFELLKWLSPSQPMKPRICVLLFLIVVSGKITDSEELVKSSRATLIEVGTDHRLVTPEPLAAMLRACGGS